MVESNLQSGGLIIKLKARSMITSHQISVLNGLKLFAVVIFLNSACILNGQKVIYTSEGSVTEIQAAKEVV